MTWKPLLGHAELEISETGKVRRIPTLGIGLDARPHPTKRIVLSDREVAALGLDVHPAERATLPPVEMPAASILPQIESQFRGAPISPDTEVEPKYSTDPPPRTRR